jgi:hypothetical protein
MRIKKERSAMDADGKDNGMERRNPFGKSFLALVISALASGISIAAAGAENPTPAEMAEWKYRVPIQVINRQADSREATNITLADFPFLTLINEGKLVANLSDLRLRDEQNESIALRPYRPTSDNGDAALIFSLPPLKGKDKRQLWLYYGNPAAKAESFDEQRQPSANPDLSIAVGAEESQNPVSAALPEALDCWLAAHRLIEAETAKGQPGFAARKPADPAKRISGGEVLALEKAAMSSVAYETDVRVGSAMSWLRYSPSDGKSIPKGALVLAVSQGGKVLAQKRLDLATDIPAGDDPTGFRWLGVPAALAEGKATLTVTCESATALLDCLMVCGDQQYRPDVRDFSPRVWMRWRVDGASDYPYWMLLQQNLKPYDGAYSITGICSGRGFEPTIGQPVKLTDEEYLHPGQFTPWIQLPVGFAYTGYELFSLQGKASVKLPESVTVRMEFANRPSPERVFHVTPAEPVKRPEPPTYNGGRASFAVHLPEAFTMEAMRKLESFLEWAKRRRMLVEGLDLGPPPHLTRLRVGTWVHYIGGGDAQAEEDFSVLEQIGINQISPPYLADATFAHLAKAHGIIDSSLNIWGFRNAIPKVTGTAFLPAETPQQFWSRVYDAHYKKAAEYHQKLIPFLLSLNTRYFVGDEIGPVIYGKWVEEDPVVFAYFHNWLKQQEVTPQDWGVVDWDAVRPLDDRSKLVEGDVAAARRLYYTRRFMDHYFILAWGSATKAVIKYYPNARMVSPIYHASPMMCGFLGTIWNLDTCMMDLFAYTRAGAFQGFFLADWVPACDQGISQVNFGAELIRATTRKTKTPAAACLVAIGQGPGGQRAKLFASLMHGVKENLLYHYGPINNIGPAFGSLPAIIRDYAETTRFMKKFENQIADGDPCPRKAAMLLAYTTDIMQAKGIYPFPERQRLYRVLDHSNIPLDLICEQEILDDDILKNYSLLYLSDPNIPAAVQQKIADWVKNGGHLWACVGAGNWDEFNRPSAILDAVFGVKSRAVITQEKWPPAGNIYRLLFQQIDTLTADAALFGGAVKLPVWGLKLACEPSTAQVVGSYGDGKPAILLNAYGKGEAMLVGALVGDAYARLHYAVAQDKPEWNFESGSEARAVAVAMADRTPGVRQQTLSVPGIYSSLWDVPGGSLLFLSNAARAGLWNPPPNLPPPPTVTVRIPTKGTIQSIESARLGNLTFTAKNEELIFSCPVSATDIIMIKTGR